MLKIQRSALFASVLLVFCCAGSLRAEEYRLSPASKAPRLSGSEGYLLLHVDAGGSAPSFEFTRITSADSEPLPEEKRLRFASKSHKISLKGLSLGFYLLPMSSGQYQITRFNVPHYDLPFRLSTDNRPEWRFVIEPGKTNYIGALYIDPERSTSHVEVDLLNRIAMQEPAIREQMGNTLKTFPLAFHAGYRDDFYQEVMRTTSSEDVQ